jgi:hypothetical protein
VNVFPPQAPTIFTGTVFAIRLIKADYIRRRLHVFHDVPLDHSHSHCHDCLPSAHMVTLDDEYARNNTVRPGTYEPTVVVDIHQEKSGQ